MPRIVIAPMLRRHIDCAPTDVPGASVREALQAMYALHPRLESYVVDEQGALRKHVVIYLNGRRIADRAAQSDAVGQADEIHVFQALSGG